MLSEAPGVGHTRRDLTVAPVRFFSAYSYVIVYNPDSRPLEVVAILHGNRDVEHLLTDRL
jgi:plasmid stabilization system protein ParE